MTTNPYADAARIRKAHAIAEALDVVHATPEIAEHMSVPEQALACRVAGVKPCSAETWGQAVGILRARLETRARYAGDPFEGLPA